MAFPANSTAALAAGIPSAYNFFSLGKHRLRQSVKKTIEIWVFGLNFHQNENWTKNFRPNSKKSFFTVERRNFQC
jgi:hypothetical protein